MKQLKMYFFCLIIIMFGFTTANADELVTNGGFETGDFTGWTKVVHGSGDFFVWHDNDSPLNDNAVLYPPEGTYAAITDQDWAGDYIIYQLHTAIPPT